MPSADWRENKKGFVSDDDRSVWLKFSVQADGWRTRSSCAEQSQTAAVCDQSVVCLKRQVLIKGSIDRPCPAVGDSC